MPKVEQKTSGLDMTTIAHDSDVTPPNPDNRQIAAALQASIIERMSGLILNNDDTIDVLASVVSEAGLEFKPLSHRGLQLGARGIGNIHIRTTGRDRNGAEKNGHIALSFIEHKGKLSVYYT